MERSAMMVPMIRPADAIMPIMANSHSRVADWRARPDDHRRRANHGGGRSNAARSCRHCRTAETQARAERQQNNEPSHDNSPSHNENRWKHALSLQSQPGCISASFYRIQHQPILAGIDKKTVLVDRKAMAGRFIPTKTSRSEFPRRVLLGERRSLWCRRVRLPEKSRRDASTTIFDSPL